MNEGETLGKYLRQQRETKKISLREVAKNTKVREHLLEAIEKDQHHLLPPATYVKGFLLSYARYLGLDPEDVLLRYQGDLRRGSVTPHSTLTQRQETKVPSKHSSTPELKTPPPSARELKQETPPPLLSTPKQKISWNIRQVSVMGGVIAVSLIMVYLFSPSLVEPPTQPALKKPAPEERVAEKPSVETSSLITAPQSVPEEKPVAGESGSPRSSPATVAPAVPEKKSLSLQMKAIEETWVSLRVDDQPEKEMTFKPGEGIAVQASNRLRIIIGNAGGLHLILDEKPLDKFGKSGEVVTLLLTSEGMEVKRGLSRE